MGLSKARVTVTTWCQTCCTRHDPGARCPGELQVTAPEQHGWRVNVQTPNGTEAYGVLIAQCHDVWRARILTFPNILWLVPGGRGTLKFLGRTPSDAERQAAAFIRAHCQDHAYKIRNDPVMVEPDRLDSEESAKRPEGGHQIAPRKVRFLPVRFGANQATEKGITGSLSESGLSIVTDFPLEPAQQVALSLEVDTSTIDLTGWIVWVREKPELGRAPGMGIRLQSPPSDYVSYVRTLP